MVEGYLTVSLQLNSREKTLPCPFLGCWSPCSSCKPEWLRSDLPLLCQRCMWATDGLAFSSRACSHLLTVLAISDLLFRSESSQAGGEKQTKWASPRLHTCRPDWVTMPDTRDTTLRSATYLSSESDSIYNKEQKAQLLPSYKGSCSRRRTTAGQDWLYICQPSVPITYRQCCSNLK